MGGAVLQIGMAAQDGPARHAQEHDLVGDLAVQVEREALVDDAEVAGAHHAGPVVLADLHRAEQLHHEGNAGVRVVAAIGRRIVDLQGRRQHRPKRAAAHGNRADLSHRHPGRHVVEREARKHRGGGQLPDPRAPIFVDAAQIKQRRNLRQNWRFHLRQFIALVRSRRPIQVWPRTIPDIDRGQWIG